MPSSLRLEGGGLKKTTDGSLPRLAPPSIINWLQFAKQIKEGESFLINKVHKTSLEEKCHTGGVKCGDSGQKCSTCKGWGRFRHFPN